MGEARVDITSGVADGEIPTAKSAQPAAPAQSAMASQSAMTSQPLIDQLKAAGAAPLASHEPQWIDLRTDLKVQVQEPAGSTQFRAATIAPMDTNPFLITIIQALLYVTQYQQGDGQGSWKPVMVQAQLRTYTQAQTLADMIGDEGLTLLQAELGVRFPASPFVQERIQQITRANRNL